MGEELSVDRKSPRCGKAQQFLFQKEAKSQAVGHAEGSRGLDEHREQTFRDATKARWRHSAYRDRCCDSTVTHPVSVISRCGD